MLRVGGEGVMEGLFVLVIVERGSDEYLYALLLRAVPLNTQRASGNTRFYSPGVLLSTLSEVSSDLVRESHSLR